MAGDMQVCGALWCSWRSRASKEEATYKTVGHDAVQAPQRLHVLVGEEELDHARVPKQVA